MHHSLNGGQLQRYLFNNEPVGIRESRTSDIAYIKMWFNLLNWYKQKTRGYLVCSL